jgi:tRNA-splicing ligase RtcB
VAATNRDGGFISPGGVGFDINCGVRLLGTHLVQDEIAPHVEDLAAALYTSCPGGVGGKGRIKVSERELDELIAEGAEWALREGSAQERDGLHTEQGGRIEGADPSKVSARAKERGLSQVGSLGGGNHFLEIDVVAKVYDSNVAEAFGLQPDQVMVQIHCGSRGFGH